jgi:hypothetical protein
MAEEAAKLEACHSTWTIARCDSCGKEQHFPNRCDLFYCPECTPRLAHEREESISWWVAEVNQPKFITLTCRNIPDMNSGHLLEFKSWWRKLRRRKFAANWRGGFYSIEVTNTGNGWHLHLHALVDARWIDGGELARVWHEVTNWQGEIVKVKDARAEAYLARVKSYIVKPEQLAKWTSDQIKTFVQTFDGARTFGVFGTLYAKRTEYAEWIKAVRGAKPTCPCGSSNIRYLTETEAIMEDLRENRPQSVRPPPPKVELELKLDVPRNWTPSDA